MTWKYLISHFSFFILFLYTSNVQDIVASNENLPKVSRQASINVLLSVGQLFNMKDLFPMLYHVFLTGY